jgi:hypothetical protein
LHNEFPMAYQHPLGTHIQFVREIECILCRSNIDMGNALTLVAFMAVPLAPTGPQVR